MMFICSGQISILHGYIMKKSSLCQNHPSSMVDCPAIVKPSGNLLHNYGKIHHLVREFSQ